jgi:FkbM family methyltransferase
MKKYLIPFILIWRLFWRASGAKNKARLADYFIRNLLKRTFSMVSLPPEIAIEMKDVKFCFAASKSELPPYLEIFADKIYNRDPRFNVEDGDIIIDAGAHIGFYSLYQGLKMKSGRIFAFEPNYDTFCRLKKNIALNNLKNIVKPENAAVAGSNGVVNLRISRGSSEGNTIMKNGTVAEYEQTAAVPAITLDEIARRNHLKKIDIIKIDTEGAEVEILKGGVGLALGMAQKIVVETHSSELKQNCEKILFEAGFSRVLVVPSGANMLGENAVVYFVKS